MGRISTHVLDTARGKPASGIKVEAFLLDQGQRRLLQTCLTNADGRTDEPVVQGALVAGLYELVFHVGDYLDAFGDAFFDTIPLRFRVADGDGHYHVPLIVTPWSYATYRGS